MDNPRSDAARAHDDTDIIDEAGKERAPSQEGSAGGNMARDVGTRAEAQHLAEDEESEVTRVRAKDKPPEANRPRRNLG